MDRLLISAAHKSSGKTTISIGLCHALSQRGHVVQPFKKGPDYIDPMWLSRATGRPCINLDFYTMQHEEIIQRLKQYGQGAGLSLIEGNKGLYDGLDLDGSNSNAALAQLLQSPVVLVIDVRGVTRGIAPLLLGYQSFCDDIHIAGVIFNQVGGRRHESKLRAVIEHYTDIPVIGAVARDPVMNIDERHLGLIPSNEAPAVEKKIGVIGQRVAEQVELDKLLEIAAGAPRLPETQAETAITARPSSPSVRIAIARDAAFGFYYPDDLEAMQQAGAELVFFDTMRDKALPRADGLFIGGGFPESFTEQLSANHAMRQSIHSAIENGLPAYAECGGLMYLCRSINWHNGCHDMVGIIPADATMHEKPQGRGYIRLQETAQHPWPRDDHDDTSVHGREISGHEFHYSGLTRLDSAMPAVYQVLRGHGIDGRQDGLIYKNLLACYAHLRDTGQNHWARRFIRFVHQCKQQTGGKQ